MPHPPFFPVGGGAGGVLRGAGPKKGGGPAPLQATERRFLAQDPHQKIDLRHLKPHLHHLDRDLRHLEPHLHHLDRDLRHLEPHLHHLCGNLAIAGQAGNDGVSSRQ